MPEHIRTVANQIEADASRYTTRDDELEKSSDFEIPRDGVLLIDDNEDDAELSLRCLNKLHLDVPILWASDSAQAIKKLENVSSVRELPRVILLDLKMPCVDGFEVLRRIRAKPKLRDMTVIVMVSSLRDPELPRSISAGASTYVVKPLRPDGFYAACERAVLNWPGR
ncbi:MAG TPA: response regulator [Burkholderiales bacterium]|nr:response regulator [Burkholderiales bacterium]